MIFTSYLSKQQYMIIGKTGFLDQAIPAGCFVRTQDLSGASEQNKMHDDCRFDHLLGPAGTRMDNH